MLPFSRRACQPFLMGKALQRPAFPRDAPKIRRAISEALLPRRGKQRRIRTPAAYPCPAGQGCVIPPTFPSALEAGANTRIHAGTCFPQKPAASDKKGRSLFLPERKEKQAQTQCRTRLTSAKTAMPPESLCFAAHHRKTAVCSHHRPNRNETQSACPLLVGRALVNTTPKALAVGTAGPQAAGPCSWACHRLLAPSPQSKRNKAPKPLLVGLGRVYLEPKALAGGAAGPLHVGLGRVYFEPKALAAGTAALTYTSGEPCSACGEAHAPCGSWASQSTPRTAS